MGTRTSFRPRQLDINKPLPIVRDLSELDADGANGDKPQDQLHQAPKKPHKEIPTPEVHIVETYHRDYLPVFQPATHYSHGKGGSGYKDDTVVEYDLDNDDEDWLEAYNVGGLKLSDVKLERMLWKLELACAEATEDALLRAGASVQERSSATALAAIDHLPKELALEVLLEVGVRDVIANDVYEYWAGKRRRLGRPILRRLQAPTSASDTNPFNVFRPREKVNRPQTRRRRDNPEECMEKLRQMQDNIRAALAIVCEIIRRERRKRDLTHTEVELQRIRVRTRHDPRFNGNQEEAAQFGMQQLKARNSKNRELDLLRAGGRQLANGVRVDPTMRPSKRQRRPELLPYLRAEVAKLGPPPPPPPEEDLAFAWPVNPQKLTEQHNQRLWRAAQDDRDMRARRAAAACAEPPPPLGAPKDVLAGAPPAVRVPDGVAAAGATRMRMGRGGRMVLDRVDPWSLEPLAAATAEERAVRQYLMEPWPQLPKGGAIREIVDRVRPTPRPTPAQQAAAQQQAAAARASSAGGAPPAAPAPAAAAGGGGGAAAGGSRMGSQGSYPLVRLPSGVVAAAAAQQQQQQQQQPAGAGAAPGAGGLAGAPSIALAPSASMQPPGAPGGAAAAAPAPAGGGVKEEPVQATSAAGPRQASGAPPHDAAAADGGAKPESRGPSPGAQGVSGPPPKRAASRPPKG